MKLSRNPELLILALAAAIAVAASTAVSLFSDRVAGALERQSGEAFGADLALSSRKRVEDQALARVEPLGLRQSRVVEFPSVAFRGEQSVLASVKAVDSAYPLRGNLRIAPQPFAPEQEVQQGPSPGQAWVDLRLWQALGLSSGDSIRVGQLDIVITQVLTYEPDRGFGFSELAPRVLISSQDLPSTGLTGPGSRLNYRYLFAGDALRIAEVADMEWPSGVRVRTPETGSRAIGDALSRARQFLEIAVLSAMLLSGAAIAVSGRQYGVRMRHDAAIMKVLGASSLEVMKRALLRLFRVALLASSLGLLVGILIQFAVAQWASTLLETELGPPRFWLSLTSLGLGLLLVMGFASPPLIAARKASPMRVLQRRETEAGSLGGSLLMALSAALLILLHARETQLALLTMVGVLIASLVLGALSWLLVLGFSRLRHGASTAIRFGLANIARRRLASVGQSVALGLSLLAFLLVGVVHSELLAGWRERLPTDAPNQFLINIRSDQLPALKTFFAERGYPDLRLWPMVRSLLVGLRGETVTADSFEDPETRRWINREFNLSWTDEFDDDNQLLEGQWWPAETHGEPWLSVDEYAVERLDLALGDRLKLQVADRQIELTVHNVRKVSWDSFRPNFFLVVAPGVLDAQDAQWLTSFHLPQKQRPLLREMIDAFPNITALDLDLMIRQIRSIVDRVIQAVEMIFGFTLLAGLAVLLAAIEGTRADRVRETALLRALGASRATVRNGLLAEYATLGLVAGAVASATAQVVGAVVAARVLELPYVFSPSLWLIGTLGGALLVSLLGWLSLRRTLQASPARVLAQTA